MYPICPPTQVGVFPTAYATRGKMLRQSFNIRRISGKSNQLVSPEEMERVRHHTHSTEYHSCQPLSGVNLSPESANLYFPQAGWCLSFFAGGSGILNSNWHMWPWKGEAMVCEIHMRDFKSHFQQDFLAYCIRPVSEHVAMACVSSMLVQWFFSLFAQFKTTTKSHENYVFLYPFSNMAISPQNNERKKYFILVNCVG